jgi:hypothetical protein
MSYSAFTIKVYGIWISQYCLPLQVRLKFGGYIGLPYFFGSNPGHIFEIT